MAAPFDAEGKGAAVTLWSSLIQILGWLVAELVRALAEVAGHRLVALRVSLPGTQLQVHHGASARSS